MRKKIELPIEEIVSKWENGATQQELADEYGISRRTIIKKIKEWYEEKGKIKPRISGKNRIELPIEEIVSKWENGATQQELADEYGISRRTIIKKIKEWYEEKGKIKPRISGKNRIELPMEEIVSKWENGAIQQELADEYGTSYITVSTRIKKWYEEKGKIKPRVSGKKRIELPAEEIVLKWKNGATLKELADEYRTSPATVRARIDKYVDSSGSKVIKERIIKEPKIVIEHLKRGATPEQIIEIAEKNRVIIPDSVMQEAIKKAQEIPEERIPKDVGRDIDE